MSEYIDPFYLVQLPEGQRDGIAFIKVIGDTFYVVHRNDGRAESFAGEIQNPTGFKRRIIALLPDSHIPGFIEAVQVGGVGFDCWMYRNREAITEAVIRRDPAEGIVVERKLRGWGRGTWKKSVVTLPPEEAPFAFAVGLFHQGEKYLFKAVLVCRQGHKTKDSEMLWRKIQTDARLSGLTLEGSEKEVKHFITPDGVSCCILANGNPEGRSLSTTVVNRVVADAQKGGKSDA